MKVVNKCGCVETIKRDYDLGMVLATAIRKMNLKTLEKKDPRGEEAHRIAGKIREEAKNGSRKD